MSATSIGPGLSALLKPRRYQRAVLLIGLLPLVLAWIAGEAFDEPGQVASVVIRGGWITLYFLSWMLRLQTGRTSTRRFSPLDTTLPLPMGKLARHRLIADVRERGLPIVGYGLLAIAAAPALWSLLLPSTAAIAVWLVAGDLAFRVLDPHRLRLRRGRFRAVLLLEAAAVLAAILEPRTAAALLVAGLAAVAVLAGHARIPDAIVDDDEPGDATGHARRPGSRRLLTPERRLLLRHVSASTPAIALAGWIAFYPALLTFAGGPMLSYLIMMPLLAQGLPAARARFGVRFGHLPLSAGTIYRALLLPLAGAVGVGFAICAAIPPMTARPDVSAVTVAYVRTTGEAKSMRSQIAVPRTFWRVASEPHPRITLDDGRVLRLNAYRIGALPVWVYHPYQVPERTSVGIWVAQLRRALRDVHGIEADPERLHRAFVVSRTGEVLVHDHELRQELDLLRREAGAAPLRGGPWVGALDWLLFVVILGCSVLLCLRDRTPWRRRRWWLDPGWIAVLAVIGSVLAARLALYRASRDVPLDHRSLLALLLDHVLPASRLGATVISAALLAVFLAAGWRIARRSCPDEVPRGRWSLRAGSSTP